MRTIDTDVLVVGAGVSGLTASVFLASQDVPALTIARHPGTAPSPRSHITNPRTMEVFRDLGIEAAVKEVATPLADLPHNVTATSLAGMELARYRAYGTGPRSSEYAAASPCAPFNAPQHLLEPVLLAAGRDRGANVRFSNELLTIEQSDVGVTAHVLDRDTGEEYVVRARYAIGADGGRSRVAEQLGFGFAGQAGLRHMVNMWLEVDLEQYTAHRPGVLYIMAQPGEAFWVGSGTFICVRPWNEWVLVREYDPTAGEPDTSDAAVTEFARTLIGDPHADVRVKGVSTWQVNNVVATEYQRGRVFLAGDAAHRHPPAGGLGSNTSIQDALNLAWKIAYVVKGRAGEGLLDSYHEERQPIGRQVIDRAMESMENMVPVIRALGFERGQTAQEGQAVLQHLFSAGTTAEQRRADLAAALDLQNYRSNALGVELGQRYTSRAVVGDGTLFPEPTRDPELHYHATTHPGAHLPHAWVEHERRQVSTLDLVGHGRFSLITGIGGRPWAEAAAKLAADLDLELPVHIIGYRCEYDDVLGDWAALREISDTGALLVRPDRHVAWRSPGLPADPYHVLSTALRHALALETSTASDAATVGA